MARTLVISDLHLGCRARSSVLARTVPRARLLDALEGVDRLVLLGDVVELLEARPAAAIDAAIPILAAIGARLGAGAEVVIVPGNHDRALIRSWVRAYGGRLTLDTEVPPHASPALSRVVEALGGARRVRVQYPGTWLGDRVWATHGHYLDRHLQPVSGYGLVRGGRHRLPEGRVAPFDYERAGRMHFSPVVRWLPAPLATVFEDLAELGRAATMPRVRMNVLHPRLAPLTSRVLSVQMRRHALPALARVAVHLDVPADWVVFGHVHRLGPIVGDDPARWVGPAGGPRLVNTGAWVYEPLLVHHASPPHPYWPGGAVVLEEGSPPRAVGLLDDVPARELVSVAGRDQR